MNPKQGQPQNPIMVPLIIWIAMMIAVVQLFFVAYTQQKAADEGFNAQVPGPLLIGAAVVAVLSRVVPGWLLSMKAREFAAKLSLTPDQAARHAFMIPFTVRLALSEAVGILGYIIFMVYKDMQTGVILGMVSLGFIFMAKPKLEDLKKIERDIIARRRSG